MRIKSIDCLAILAVVIAATMFFSSCEEENSIKLDDGTVFSSTEMGDDFIDEEESYILSSSTQSSTVLPYEYKDYNITYRIRNASDLKLFVELVNNGEFEKIKEKFTESSQTCCFQVELDHDITIDESFIWTPIGNGIYPMNMTFNGKGHTISGVMNSKGSHLSDDHIYLEDGSQKIVTRHGFLGLSEGTITNLNLNADLIINHDGAVAVLSGLLAAQSNGFVENVNVSGELRTSILHIHNDYLCHGHLIGLGNVSAKNCTTQGTVTLKKGGTYNYSIQTENAYIGGLVGISKEGVIESCSSSVNINISDSNIGNGLYVGGIVALTSSYMEGHISDEIYMLEVENKGDIAIEAPRKPTNNDNASIIAGGVLGYGSFRAGLSGKIINSGSIYIGSTPLIGIVGGVVGYYNDIYAETNVTNAGIIKNYAKKSITGGCYGQVADVEPTIQYAYNSGDITATEVELSLTEDSGYRIYGLVGGIVGKATIMNMGLLGQPHRSGSIHQCSNSGNVQSGGTFTFNGLECETAGCISGDGYSMLSCNSSYGTINGETPYPWKYNGTTWAIKEKLDNGDMTEEHEYWSFWKDFINMIYGCEH